MARKIKPAPNANGNGNNYGNQQQPVRKRKSREEIRNVVLTTDPTRDYQATRFAYYGELFVSRLPQWRLWTGRMMLTSDPIVHFALNVRNSALMPAEIVVEGKDEKVVQWVQDQWDYLWNHHRTQIVNAKRFGFQALQVEYKLYGNNDKPYDDETIVIDGLKDFAPEDARAMEADGKVVGQRIQDAVFYHPQALWMTFGMEYGNPYGTGCLRRAYPAWYEKWMDHGAKRLMQLRMIKDAYIGDIFWYPHNQLVTLPDGTQMPWRDLMRELGENRLSGGALTMPMYYDNEGHKLTDYTPPQDVPGGSQIFEWKDMCDEGIMQGFDVPLEVTKAATVGSGYSGRSIPFLVLLSVGTQELTEIIQCLDAHVFRPVAWLNWGGDVDYTIKPRSLVESFSEDTSGSPMGGAALGGPASEGPPPPPQQPQQGGNIQFGEDETKHPFESKGTERIAALHHSGARKIKKIDPDMLQTRDSGFYGRGFYTSTDKDYTKSYGRHTSTFRPKPHARILHSALNAKDAPELHKAILEHSHKHWRPAAEARGKAHLHDEEMAHISKSPISWKNAVSRYAHDRNYDIVHHSAGEVVIRNTDSVEHHDEKSQQGGNIQFGESEYNVSHAHYGGKHQFVFKQGGKEIGEISTTARSDGHHEVSNVLVWPDHQRKGHATKFYKHAHDFAKSQGKKLYISNDRTPDAQNLHKHFTAKGNLKSSGEIQFAESVAFDNRPLHAPPGGVTIHGVRYAGGEFIPKEVIAELSDEDRRQLRAGTIARHIKKRPELAQRLTVGKLAERPKANAPGSQMKPEIKEKLKQLGMVGTFPPAGVAIKDVKIADLSLPPKQLENQPLLQWEQVTKSGRVSRQYRYTATFMRRNAKRKFARVMAIEPHLNKIGNRLNKIVGDKTAEPERREAAAIASIILETGLRPTDGAESIQHGHHGVASLLGKHVTVKGNKVHLDFIGKEGVRNQAVVSNPSTVQFLKSALKGIGPKHFVFQSAHSGHAGDLLKEISVASGGPDDIKLKDLRTIKATQTARNVVRNYDGPPPPITGNKSKDARAIKSAIIKMSGEVAKVLNNTPTQARDNYIHPEIFKEWQAQLALS